MRATANGQDDPHERRRARDCVLRHRADGPCSSRRLPSFRRRPARRARRRSHDRSRRHGRPRRLERLRRKPRGRRRRRPSARPLEPARDRGSGARPRRDRPVPFRRTALLAVPAMGAALGAGASLADRPPDPSALRALAQLPRSARVSRGARCSRTRGSAKPLRLLPRTLVPERLSRRRVFARGYDVAACAGHLEDPAGADCMGAGCRARRACPVGAEHAYGHEQANFTMRAFLRAQGAPASLTRRD